mmetsp:Transcript_27126/g.94107  ORF Transcript_27126/g.94107 Transcript_27126/m.94107 type:complete len:255 (+) Transcript_27126:339-1103(+)
MEKMAMPRRAQRSYSAASTSGDTPAVHSSRMANRGRWKSRRAKAMRCFCPGLSAVRQSSSVSSDGVTPSHCRSSRCAHDSTWRMSSSVRPIAAISLGCRGYVTRCRSVPNGTKFTCERKYTSLSSGCVMVPATSGHRPLMTRKSDDLPTPLLPVMSTRLPASTSKLRSCTSSTPSGLNTHTCSKASLLPLTKRGGCSGAWLAMTSCRMGARLRMPRNSPDTRAVMPASLPTRFCSSKIDSTATDSPSITCRDAT